MSAKFRRSPKQEVIVKVEINIEAVRRRGNDVISRLMLRTSFYEFLRIQPLTVPVGNRFMKVQTLGDARRLT